MKIELTPSEVALLLELMQEWKTHRPYHIDEINIINGIVQKIHRRSTPLPKIKKRETRNFRIDRSKSLRVRNKGQ